ncbi:class I SAM-dependent methyltransferase [Methylobacterium sp. C25]|uniref:class I SAM-dependent methyltransferase n=1 Tax=Methylobacterium sp. C25 TaxID=2721622 RepID=UPI001F2B1655|nr:class I SAM-dependent methyltransferase [Methylobacterium sp. C25]MCE4222675.1 class I SAM-dependent methyltransferase [Methylobacterium sp. C25]
MSEAPQRKTLDFIGRSDNRFWWYQRPQNNYVPPIFQSMTDVEWSLMADWFLDTGKKFKSPGEISVPGISLLLGLISGNGISRVVQCGHYAGYSTLLLGFALARMGKNRALWSVDIDRDMTDYTEAWIQLANLSQIVKLEVMDSADKVCPERAYEWLDGKPQIVFIDSSHMYEHTLRELELWWNEIVPGGFLVLHDVSRFAKAFDASSNGGVLPAVQEWAACMNLTPFLINSFVDGNENADDLPYQDGCGLGIVQKPWIRC